MKKFVEMILKPLETVAETLKFKNATSMVLEVGLGLFVFYALSVVLSAGWQSNLECVTFRPLLSQALACANLKPPDNNNRFYPQLNCILLSKGGYEIFNRPNQTPDNSSYWYDRPNGTNLIFPILKDSEKK